MVTSLCWLHAAWYTWLAAPLFWLCGVLIYTSVLVWFGSISFRWLGPQLSSMMVAHNLLQATRYPLPTYPRWIRALLLFALPFGTFHYLPGSVLFGKGAPVAALLCAPLAVVVTMLLAQNPGIPGSSTTRAPGRRLSRRRRSRPLSLLRGGGRRSPMRCVRTFARGGGRKICCSSNDWPIMAGRGADGSE